MTKQNVLITGGAGFIGSNLALALIDRGHRVRVMDNLSPQIHSEESPLFTSIEGRVEFLRGDVRLRADWEKALKGIDAVVHLAAETGTGQSMYQIEQYIDVNVRGTSLLLDLIANSNHSIKKLVVASSRAIYGEGKYSCATHGFVYPLSRSATDMQAGDFEVKCPTCGDDVSLVSTDEESKLHPTSVYGITKLNQEQMILVVGRSLGISSIALRYQNVYGPGQSLSNPYTGILSIFSTRIKNGHEILVFEDGKESRDFVHISDVVQATVASIENEDIINESFNIGAGAATDVLTVANTLASLYQSDIPIHTTGNFRLGDIRHNVADISKAKKLLQYKPSMSFEVGIKTFVQWVETQKIAIDKYAESIDEMRKKGLYR